ncbi:hypothetical protein FRC12_007749 [Ceratobasidium sp. 428]|nr:hypothetical protein FRC12_007749 [Ceratobasidium sp. 428]
MLDKLPPELACLIICRVSPWELSNISLVCKGWQSVTFPILYRTLFFDNYETTNMLVDRINCECPTSQLRLTACVCELLVSLDPVEVANRDDEAMKYSAVGLHSIRDTELAMSKLKNLERIYWGSAWSLVLPQTLREVQVHTKVQSIDLQVELFRLDQASAEKVFALEGLKKFYVTLSFTPPRVVRSTWGTHDEEETEDEDNNPFALLDLPSLLLEMLRASPDLEELGFTFRAQRSSTSPTDRRNPDNMFTALASHIFPCLRVFRVFEFWEHDESVGLRRFLLNHPNLHTVDMHLNLDMDLWFDTEDIETVFPSVRDFKGPYRICYALTRSSIAQQLENLTIRKIFGIRYSQLPGPPGPYGQSSPLPRLRELEVIYSQVHIHDLVEMTPNVEKVRMSSSLDVYFKHTVSSRNFMKFLRHTPRLCALQLYLGGPDTRKSKPTAEDVMWFMGQVVSICPQLFRIEYLRGDSSSYWDIVQGHDGDASFHYHFDPRFDLFPGLELPKTAITSGLSSHPWNKYEDWYGSLG